MHHSNVCRGIQPSCGVLGLLSNVILCKFEWQHEHEPQQHEPLMASGTAHVSASQTIVSIGVARSKASLAMGTIAIEVL